MTTTRNCVTVAGLQLRKGITMVYTPGPWNRGIDNKERNIIRSFNKKTSPLIIATLRTGKVAGPAAREDDANAHLITAAPELLEVVETLLPYFKEGSDGYKLIKTTINKAKGKR